MLGVYALYRPHGTLAAGALTVAAGLYELTPLERACRRRCREDVRSGLRYGVLCVGVEHRADGDAARARRDERRLDGVVAALVLSQKLLSPRASVDVPLALAIVALGVVVAIEPSAIPGLTPRDVNEEGERMTTHTTGTREEWLAARLELLDAEKELTRQQRRARPAAAGAALGPDREGVPLRDRRGPSASLADLFRGRSQLLVYHFMFGPDYSAGCPACSAIADGFNGFAIHLANHDVMLWAVSRAPLEKLQGYKQRMGWSFPWASSFGSDFNDDFDVSLTEEQERAGAFEYNFRESPVWSPPEDVRGPFDAWAATTGTDWATYTRERPGMSAFALEDGVVYHTYSAYARGLDGLWGMYQWLDRAPRGRNEARGPDDPLNWFRRHDEYGTE